MILVIDQSSTFDSITHQLLLDKMKIYNVGKVALDWTRDYLSNRSQFVAIVGGISRTTPVTTGLPQGSVIGPLLYSIFTNEMTEVIKSPNCSEPLHLETKRLFNRQCTKCGVLSTYADDTTYVISNKQRNKNQVKIVDTVENIRTFLNDNKLAMNLGKTATTECMLKQMKGRTPGTPPSLQVEKEPGVWKHIKNAEYTRILGANLQGNLWSSHLETGERALFPQVRRQIGLLRHKGKLIPLSSRNNLARGLILSKLNYLMPIWGGATKKYIRKAQVLVNNAARWVTGVTRKTKTRILMKTVGWFTVEEQIKIATAIFTWKLVHMGNLLDYWTE